MLCTLPAFAKAVPDLAKATRIIKFFVDARYDAEFYPDEVRSAVAIGKDDRQAADLLIAYNRSDHQIWQSLDPLIQLADAHLLTAVAGCILSDQRKSLQKIASLTQMVTSLGGDLRPTTVLPCDTGWLEAYPPALHEDLSNLACVAKDGQRVAREILERDFPNPQKTKREIAAIEDRLDHSDGEQRERLIGRLNNLRGRLAARPDVSFRRVENLGKKLRARHDYEVILQFTNRCREQISQLVQSQTELDYEFPDELFESPLDQVVASILALEPKMRRLGLRLIFETFRHSTRRFDDERPNLAFRNRMQSRGIRMEPWLNDDLQTTRQTKIRTHLSTCVHT